LNLPSSKAKITRKKDTTTKQKEPYGSTLTDKLMDKKKSKSRRKQSILPLQPLLPPETSKDSKLSGRISTRRYINILAKEVT
jgi:hypothetical protein